MGFSSNPVCEEASNQKAEQLKCPRCDSNNTKFCYFNNYSRSQPRHFCKACKRHWTAGGTLRNVPIGGCRKANRRSKASSQRPSAKQTINLLPSPHLLPLVQTSPEFTGSGDVLGSNDCGLSLPLFLNLMGPEDWPPPPAMAAPWDLTQPPLPPLEFSSSSSASSGCWGSCWDDLSGLLPPDDGAVGLLCQGNYSGSPAE